MENISQDIVKTKADKKNKFFASRKWYAAALGIILWAILQEIIMASTDIVDNIFVNSLQESQINGLEDLNRLIESVWNSFGDKARLAEILEKLGKSTEYANGYHYNAGQIAVNGVTASNQLYIIMFCMVSGFCYGCGIYSAQYYGAKDYEKLRQITALKMYTVLGITTIFALFALPGLTERLVGFSTNYSHELSKPAEETMTNSEESVKQWFNYFQNQATKLSTEQGCNYYRIVAPTYMLLVVNEVAITSLRETRRPFFSFWMSLIALSTNCLANVFLTAPTFMGEFKGFGVKGTAIATASSRFLQMFFIIGLLSIKKFEFIPRFISFRIENKLLKKGFSKASPVLLNELLWAFGSMVQIKIKGEYSVESLTANAIFSTITMAIFSPLYHGLTAGISVFVGNELGSNNLSQAEYNAKHLLRLSFMIAIFFGLLLSIASYWIPRTLFSSSNLETKRIAFWLLFIYGFLYPAVAIANANYSILRAGGDVWSAFAIDSVFNWIVEMPLLAILVTLTVNNIISLDIIYIHLIVTTCEIFKALFGYMFYRKKRWIRNLTEEEHKTMKEALIEFRARMKKRKENNIEN